MSGILLLVALICFSSETPSDDINRDSTFPIEGLDPNLSLNDFTEMVISKRTPLPKDLLMDVTGGEERFVG